eukprot:10365535-Lingulodinium_polyedra.AAC.1
MHGAPRQSPQRTMHRGRTCTARRAARSRRRTPRNTNNRGAYGRAFACSRRIAQTIAASSNCAAL